MPSDATTPTPPAEPDIAELSGRIGALVERSSRVWADALDRHLEDVTLLKPDPLNTMPSMARWMYDFWDRPDRMAQSMGELWAAQADLWTRTVSRAWLGEDVSPLIQPAKGDKRFKHAMWNESPFYDFLKQSYLLTAEWLKSRLDDADNLTVQDRKKLALITRNFIEALAPSNLPYLNPEVLRTTIDEKGNNLLRGLEHLVRDLERGHGQLLIQQTDMGAFKVGENMATTPGAVVFENDLFQLIQYAPTTETVHRTPLLFVPPWINKFYILDLNEKKSMIRWLVAQGHTAFVISWVNPSEKQKEETWTSYMQKGVLTAIEHTLRETGEEALNIVGYCIGGTMLGTTLAYMAETGDQRVRSATFFTAQLDFSDAGELQAFVDDEVLGSLEEVAEEKGYLAAENMFAAFNSLRSTDLIWGFVINNYLLGKDNFPFDLLYWNSDSTAMPGRTHVFYLDQFYNRNAFARGEMELDGVLLDPAKIRVPCMHIGAVEDHIAPAASAYRAAKLIGSRNQSFVLAGSGHIAGVINPPAAGKYQHWVKKGLKGRSLEEWREGAEEHPGSWWPVWDTWLASHSKGKVAGREPGAVHGRLEPAPGRYVKERFDER